METKERELWADFAKGICILLVFIGHLDVLPKTVRILIYLFHMPMFFFCMGFYINIYLDVKSFIKKRIIKLLIPYYSFGFFIIFYDNLKSYLSNQHFDLSAVINRIIGLFINNRSSIFPSINWFLICSFISCIYYYFFRRVIKNIRMEIATVFIISMILTYLSRFLNIALPWYIDVAFPCVIYLYLGAYIKEKRLKLNKSEIFVLSCIVPIVVFVICTILINDVSKYLIDYHMLRLFPYSLVTLGGVVSCLLIYAICQKFKRKNILSYIGENSLIYYMFDWAPVSIVNRILYYTNINNYYVRITLQFLGIIIITPIIVIIIKRYFWFLFGKRKETWSINYFKNSE